MEPRLYVPPYYREEEEEANILETPPTAPQEAVEAPSIPELPVPTETPQQPVAPLTEAPRDYYVPNYYEPDQEQEPTPSPQLTRDEVLTDPERINTLRNYMVNRKGEAWLDRSDDEILDGFLSQMRWVGTNEVSLAGEWLHIQRGDETTKAIAGDAYRLYDEIAPFWDSGNFWEGVSAVGEYAGAAIVSPSTLLSLGLGKMVGQAAVTGSARLLLQEAMKTGGQEAVETVARSYARRRALSTAAVATGIDATANATFDLVYQRDLMMATGAQEEFNWLQLGLAAGLGTVAGGLSYVPEASRGISRLSAQAVRQSRADASAEALGKAAPRIKTEMQKLVDSLNRDEWQASVSRGGDFDLRQSEVDKFVHHFLDVKNDNSVVNILRQSGANIPVEEGRFTEGLISYLNTMPREALDEMNEIFEPALGVTFGETMDIIANSMSASGSRQGTASQAARAMNSYYQLSGAKARANQTISEIAEEMDTSPVKFEDRARVVRYAQSLWRRALVSHPSTTAVNVQGWAIAYGTRTLAETALASTNLVKGSLEALATGNLRNKSFARSSALFKNQIFKLQTLLDPYSTRESFEALLEKSPKNFKEVLMREHFGGIGAKDNLEIYGIPENKATRSMEKVAKFASDASLVTFQDTWTKTLSGITSLDKNARLKTGKGISELMRNKQLHLLDEEMWENSVSDALVDTFSKDYTRDGSHEILKYLARGADALSNAPGLGFVFPFGKFMTNALAWSSAYSPLGLLRVANLSAKKNLFGTAVPEGEISESLAKALVGSVGLWMLGKASYDKQGEGFQWNEVETSTGDIIDIQSIAPLSGHVLAGRMYHLWANNEFIPRELWTELSKQLAVGQYAESIAAPNMLKDLVDGLSQGSDEDRQYFDSMSREALKFLFNVASGFTRPLEPINMAADMWSQSKVNVDRRIPNTTYDIALSEFTRYTDALFYPILGPVDEDGPLYPARSATRPEGDIRDPNPIARLAGFRRAPPKNSIDRLLGSVNLPAFTLDSRTAIPEWDRFINEEVAPVLNHEAERLLNSPFFQSLPKDSKIVEIRNVLSGIKSEIIELTTEGLYSSHEATLLNERRKFSGMREDLRKQAKSAFGWTDVGDRELSLYQIHTLREWMKLRQEEMGVFTGR